ncbi:hypothetical protein [Luteimonas terrae]|uniref:Uncharacterized protein n=1 Tax=Luteimonas terrae TaxID=1530191 RepID=A0ABU1XV73_9GAMM|nr:hypothetical protein [Luteimonas terrae]MDR7192640.1 hypothetical protein [Luteimonas terrae]
MWDELENALAWYAAAPGRWVDSAKQDLSAAAEWIWEVLQGDFNEEQTTAQVVTNTAISMIPIVDQICDVRDLVANCRKIHDDTNNKWAWVALVLTLIGLFPTLGSLVKGCLKILFAYGRRGVLSGSRAALDSDLWNATRRSVEAGIRKLNEFLARPAVRRAISRLRVDNIYKHLASEVRRVAAMLSVSRLTGVFDELLGALRKFVDMIQRWGSAALGTRAGQLLESVLRVRRLANAKLAEALAPVRHWLNQLARRLDIEADMQYRALVNARNPHAYARPRVDDELAQFERAKPEWVDKTGRLRYEATERAPNVRGWPNIGESGPRPLKGAFETFHGNINHVTYPPGTRLYRVVDPGRRSFDNGTFWMTEAEFRKLTSKTEWRRRFAVWANWNGNGEYVTYTVPPGRPLRAWEGQAASQQLKLGYDYVLEGGARQIVLDPGDLDIGGLGPRRATGWGYSDFGESVGLVGVPTLKNNWYSQ